MQVTVSGSAYFKVDYLGFANTSNPCVVVSGVEDQIVCVIQSYSTGCTVALYNPSSPTPVRNGNFSLLVFDNPPNTKENVPVLYEDPEDDPDYAQKVKIT